MGSAFSAAACAVVALTGVIISLINGPPRRPVPVPQVVGKTPEQLRDEARRDLGIDTINSYNFGISGFSGTGKSSLINAVRGIEDGAPGAANVDEVECTTEISRFPFTGKLSHIVLWDMPGAGTPTHSADNYFMDKKLYAFDMIILNAGVRFTEADLAIAVAAQKFNVPIVFVRSKSDVDIDNASRRLKKSPASVKLEVREKIVSNIKQQLPNELQDREIFVINSRVFGPKTSDWDPAVYALDEQKLFDYVAQVAFSRRSV